MPNLPNLLPAERELERLHAESTPGEWSVSPVCDKDGIPYPTLYQTWAFIEPAVMGGWCNEGKNLTDLHFAALSHNLTPTLLATISELRGEVARLTEERKELILKLSESNMQIGRLQGKLEFSELAKSPLVDVNAICAERDAARGTPVRVELPMPEEGK